jgi:N-acetylmuramoyl-L-alanine amidase
VRRLIALACLVAAALLATPSQASPVKPDYVRIVANQSSREGSRPRLIVLHTTTDPHRQSAPVVTDQPGIRDLKRLGAYLDKPRTEVSLHVANDADGNDARYVRDRRKAWTEAAFNAVGLSIEQIGSAGFDRGEWLDTRAPQLESTARWIAHWHRRWGIPIRRAEVSGTRVTRSGVATHEQLGAAGGGHHDPGAGYPFKYVLRLARSFAAQ